jgi:hypothetical protein
MTRAKKRARNVAARGRAIVSTMKPKPNKARAIYDAFMRGAFLNCVAITFELAPITVERIVRQFCRGELK